MTVQLQDMPTATLVERFVAVALAQDHALLEGSTDRFNSLYDEMNAINAELKSRAGDQRSALRPLCKHPNAHVRLKAAISILAVAFDLARETLELIVAQREYPQSADARGMLRALEEGTFIPN
jgi:hypothetical protein